MPVVLLFLGLYVSTYGQMIQSSGAEPTCSMATHRSLPHRSPSISEEYARARKSIWPMKLPLVGTCSQLWIRALNLLQRPQHLEADSQAAVFFHSLFEIGHPSEYEHRARWIIDRGNADVAFRSGGLGRPCHSVSGYAYPDGLATSPEDTPETRMGDNHPFRVHPPNPMNSDITCLP